MLRQEILGILIALIIVVVVLWGFWQFMNWEFRNANNNKIGLLKKDNWLAYNTIMPDWVNDAWKSTMTQVLYKEAEYGLDF